MKNKGGILIVVVMVATVVTIIASGISVYLNFSTNLTFASIDRSKLYYAAESGANYNLKWLKNIQYVNFDINNNASTTADGFTNEDRSLSINDCTVTLKAEVDTSLTYPQWKLISEATNGKQTCRITYESVKSVSALQYCNFTGEDMWDNTNVSFTTSQNWFGKTYWDGKIPIKVESGNKTATFFGLAETASKKRSTRGNDSTNDYWHFTDPILASYYKGLNIFGSNVNKAASLLSILNNTFRGGYNYSVPEQPLEDMAISWSEFTAHPQAVNLANYGLSGSLSIYFSKNLPAFTYDGTDYPLGDYAIVTDSNGKKVIIPQNSSTKVITVPSSLGGTHIKGEVTSDITIVTQSDNIYFDGDFYATDYNVVYQGSRKYTELSDNDMDATGIGGGVNSKIQETLLSMNNISSNIEIGLIAGREGRARFIVPETSETDIKNDVVLVTAGLFSPIGNSEVGDLTANYSDFDNYVNLLVYGAFITKWGEGVTTDGSQGVNPSYAGDPKFMTGNRAPGFKSSTERDPTSMNMEHKFSDGIKWKIEWL
ncbi:MAG: hypothetical protein JXR48_16535 [Candidatus Delongbacteria bacterium]|nr:hypothetical protein [Candidatus Delongbacteria bacterium]MBN2836566.1 hypothetical protein [Candidatus Delongbacteria bacterium]